MTEDDPVTVVQVTDFATLRDGTGVADEFLPDDPVHGIDPDGLDCGLFAEGGGWVVQVVPSAFEQRDRGEVYERATSTPNRSGESRPAATAAARHDQETLLFGERSNGASVSFRSHFRESRPSRRVHTAELLSPPSSL